MLLCSTQLISGQLVSPLNLEKPQHRCCWLRNSLRLWSISARVLDGLRFVLLFSPRVLRDKVITIYEGKSCEMIVKHHWTFSRCVRSAPKTTLRPGLCLGLNQYIWVEDCLDRNYCSSPATKRGCYWRVRLEATDERCANVWSCGLMEAVPERAAGPAAGQQHHHTGTASRWAGYVLISWFYEEPW